MDSTTMLVMPLKLLFVTPLPWQLAQPVAMPLWLNWPLAKVVMPAAGTKPVGTLFTWHRSQAAAVGTWAGETAVMVCGYTPVKVLGVTLAPWQVAHAAVAPVWLNKEPEKRAPSGTGVEAMLELGPTWQLSQPADPMGMCAAGTVTIGLCRMPGL